MKKKNMVFVGLALVILILAFVIGVKRNSKSENKSDQTKVSEIQTTPKKETWTCTMHPQVHLDHPGQCPICGMNLVKIQDDSDRVAGETERRESENETMPEGHAAFKLSLNRQQLIGVKYGVVEKKPLFKSIQASGRLAFDPELYTAQNEYIEAIKQLTRVQDSPLPDVRHSAEAMVRSAKLRLKVLGISDSQITQFGNRENPESSLLIGKPGQQVWVYAEVYEMDLPQLKPGLSSEVSAGFLGGEVLAGKVVSIDRVINPQTRTAKARILVSDAKTLLRPESYVDVVIHAPLGDQVTVPFDAVFDTGKAAWVFVTDGQGNFIPRKIQIKLRAGEDVAVEKGLQAGEKIVTSANFLIDSESRLKGNLGETPKTSGKEGENSDKPKTPACPSGQHWDTSMSMCM